VVQAKEILPVVIVGLTDDAFLNYETFFLGYSRCCRATSLCSRDCLARAYQQKGKRRERQKGSSNSFVITEVPLSLLALLCMAMDEAMACLVTAHPSIFMKEVRYG
jgi:hypothetical protein